MQNIPPDFILKIVKYGYLIIVMMVFLQEVGFPNPIPNELVLLLSGYLSFTGMLKIQLVILAAVLGDLLGSGILFSVFFFFGKTIMKRKPRWLPVSQRKLHKLSLKLQHKGFAAILIGRLLPFVRGYVSVLMGLMNFPAKKYSLVLLLTAIFWSCFYVSTGFLIGPYWRLLSGYIAKGQPFMGFIPLIILLAIILLSIIKYSTKSYHIKNQINEN